MCRLGATQAAREAAREPRRWGAPRTEGLGRLKEEQPEVGPKGAASGTMQVKDCREAAPNEERVGNLRIK
jgi:hypothetical protein